MMKTLKIIFIISSFVCLNTYLNATKPIFLKQQVSNFLHPVVGEKINTKDFNIIIEKMPQEPIEKEDLSDAEIEEILIPSDQRTFEVCLKLGSGNTVNFSGKIEWLANIPTLLKPLGSNDSNGGHGRQRIDWKSSCTQYYKARITDRTITTKKSNNC